MVGLRNFVAAWNAHTIPHKGVTDALFTANLNTARIPPQFLPPAAEVAADYIRNGGSLTYPAPFGRDPLAGHPDLREHRERMLLATCAYEETFYSCLTGQVDIFCEVLETYMNITNRLEI